MAHLCFGGPAVFLRSIFDMNGIFNKNMILMNCANKIYEVGIIIFVLLCE